VVRVRLPSGMKLTPHWHHEDRVYTQVSQSSYPGFRPGASGGKRDVVTQLTLTPCKLTSRGWERQSSDAS
jgi:hypothetical protein